MMTLKETIYQKREACIFQGFEPENLRMNRKTFDLLWQEMKGDWFVPCPDGASFLGMKLSMDKNMEINTVVITGTKTKEF